MKKNICKAVACIFIVLLTRFTAIAQKNYISVETGAFFGGPAGSISSQMENSGFGMHAYGRDFPYTNLTKVKYWFRYGRELPQNKSIEINYGMVHQSVVDGFASQPDGPNTFSGNGLLLDNKVTVFSGNYIFNSAKHNAGFGGGPALSFYKLGIEKIIYPIESDSKNYLHPGISGTAFWRFINGKIFFMVARFDAMFFLPAKIDAIDVINDGFHSYFPATNVNSFVGDFTIAAGFKF
ncbi:MAG TPA: hypothetical protein VK668_17910 [Mucilaginibacter sp.]|nr:hypothetical protein [Mucilaginibacter sp.]